MTILKSWIFGVGWLEGKWKEKFLRSDVKNINSSVLARLSPKQTLFPIENGKKLGVSIKILPSESRNLSGVNFSGSSQYSESKWVDKKFPNNNVPLGNE